MAIEKREVYACDRCGHEENDPDFKRREKWYETKTCDGFGDHKALLCRSCFEDFEKWVKNPISVPKMVNIGGGPYRGGQV